MAYISLQVAVQQRSQIMKLQVWAGKLTIPRPIPLFHSSHSVLKHELQD